MLFSFSFFSVFATNQELRPKVSVVVPVYGVEKWLRECMDNLVNQTLKEIEFICVDDGSPDNCGAILDEYAKKVKDYMIAEKIPKMYREQIPLLAEEDHVLWLVGYRISEYYKVDENTKKILQVRFKQTNRITER